MKRKNRYSSSNDQGVVDEGRIEDSSEDSQGNFERYVPAAAAM